VNWEKILANVYHMALLAGSAYIAAYPEGWAWLLPVLQFYGQTLPPPDFQPTLKLEGVTHA
jgi:hypothetical protein